MVDGRVSDRDHAVGRVRPIAAANYDRFTLVIPARVWSLDYLPNRSNPNLTCAFFRSSFLRRDPPSGICTSTEALVRYRRNCVRASSTSGKSRGASSRCRQSNYGIYTKRTRLSYSRLTRTLCVVCRLWSRSDDTLRRTNALVVRGPEALAVAGAASYRGPAVTVEYCIDAGVFHAANRQLARRALSVSGFTIGYVGRLENGKGLAKVVTAVARCRAQPLLLLGAGPEHAALGDQAKSLGITDRVRFLPPGHSNRWRRFTPEKVAADLRDAYCRAVERRRGQ